MFRMRLSSFALVCALGVGALVEAKPVSGNIAVTPATHYIWRGYDLGGGGNFPIQPSVTASLDDIGLSANVAGSWTLRDRSTSKTGDEIDYTLDYSRSVSDLIGVSTGFIYYTFPNASSLKTQELYLGASFSTVLSPSVTAYYDTKWLDDSAQEADGWYVFASVSQSVPVGSLPLDLGAGLGFASNSAFDGLEDLTVSASTSIPAGPLSLTPFLNAAYIFQNAVNADNYEIWGGITASYGF